MSSEQPLFTLKNVKKILLDMVPVLLGVLVALLIGLEGPD